MQLTDKQQATIITWAEKTPEVEAVILYGSRSKGTARLDSDVDLALVMTRGPDRNQRADNYLHNYEAWETGLEEALGLKVHLGSLDPPLGREVPSYAADGIELWRRAS
jgi:predicted nucleotidyltransferase